MTHSTAVTLAERAIKRLDAIEAHIGGVSRPNTGVWQAYRQTRRAINAANGDAALIADALTTLRRRLRALATALLADADAAGFTFALRVLNLFGDAVPDTPPIALLTEPVLAEFERQAVQAQQALTVGEVALLLGGGATLGIVQPAPVAVALSDAISRQHQAAIARAIDALPQSRRQTYRKQAIATLGNRTTQCCLNIHGQIREIGEPFRLSGTPRFAAEMQGPPFHHRCRTVVTMLPADTVSDALTTKMRRGASEELSRRKYGGSPGRGTRTAID